MLVIWDDIVESETGWRSCEEALDWSNSEDSYVRQVGFLLDKDENYTTLVCSYFTEELVGTVVRIPTGAIKYMKELPVKWEEINKKVQ